jgi:hypothetical protein
MYYTNNKPKQISLELLDAVIMHAVSCLRLADFTIEMNFKKLSDGTAACVDYDEDEKVVELDIDQNIWKKPQELERTIFHELVHAKQIIDGRLELGWPSKWMGNVYTCSYLNLPWEKEAYFLEDLMINTFITVDIPSESV